MTDIQAPPEPEAPPADQKPSNSAIVKAALSDGQPRHRTAIAEATGLTATQVSNAAQALIGKNEIGRVAEGTYQLLPSANGSEPMVPPRRRRKTTRKAPASKKAMAKRAAAKRVAAPTPTLRSIGSDNSGRLILEGMDGKLWLASPLRAEA